MQSTDVFVRFLRDARLRDVMTVSHVHTVFVEWFRHSFPNGHVPTQTSLVENLTPLLGYPVTGCWVIP